MSRMSDLEARRLALLARCEAQRAEIAQRLNQLRPRSWLASAARAGGAGAAAALKPTRHPLAWVAAVAGILAFGRTREVLTAIVWARSAMSLVARVTEVVSLATALRRARPRARTPTPTA
jgi:hypothetical protein